MSESPAIRLRRAAMDYLARREHSFHELTVKLESKFPDFDKTDDIFPALSKLQKEGLQSDQRFLEAFIRYRRNKGNGPLKINSELYHKGVDSSMVKAELYGEDHDWFECCQRALEKRFKVLDTSSQKEVQRCHRFLAQRGFESEMIREALKLK